MLCEDCLKHISREISALEGKTVNCLAYGCRCIGDDPYQIRKRLDEYHSKQIEKSREERNRPA